MEDVSLAAVDNGVAGIVSTLAANDHVRFRGEHIDNLALAFVTPLRANQNCVCHLKYKFGQKIFPTHRARRSRDLPTNDKNSSCRAQAVLHFALQKRQPGCEPRAKSG